MRLSHLYSAIALGTLLVACGDDDDGGGKSPDIDVPSDTDTDIEEPTDTDIEEPTDTDTDIDVPSDTDTDIDVPSDTDTDIEEPTDTDTDIEEPTDTDTDIEEPTDTDTDTDSDSEEPTPGCTHSGFPTAVIDAMYIESWGGYMVYVQSAAADVSPVWNALEINIWEPDIAPGTYELGPDTNPADCTYCFFAKTNCEDFECESLFFASEGSFTVHELSPASAAPFNITIDSMKLSQVDPVDYTPLPEPETWCLTNVNLSGSLQ